MVPIKFSIASTILFSCLAIAAPQDPPPNAASTSAEIFSAAYAVPTGYPKPSNSHCNDLGDCVSDTVKWGHPAPYKSGATNIVPFSVGDFFHAAMVDAQSTAGNRTPTQKVYLPYVFDGPDYTLIDGSKSKLELKLTMNNGQSITWADLATEWSILSAAANQLYQTTSGTIWTKDTQNAKAIGSWSLDFVP